MPRPFLPVYVGECACCCCSLRAVRCRASRRSSTARWFYIDIGLLHVVNKCKCPFSIPHAGRGDDLVDTLADIAVDDGLFIGDTATLQELTKDIHLTADLTHFFD